MKIVILDGYTVNPGDLSWASLEALGDLTVYDRTAPEDTISRIGSSDIVITNKTLITGDVMDACPKIRLICVLATGYNVVDCQAARERAIPVCNVPGYGTMAVAQFTFSLILELCNRVGLHSQAVHEGQWAQSRDFCFWLTPQTELAGKTLGIIGFGAIGKAVAAIARAFGMEVLAYSRSQHPENDGLARYVDLKTLLAQSDILSLHCPLTEQTREIIDAAAIEGMKDGAILINTARGPLVEESALAHALKSGKLAGAAMDVVSREPMDSTNPLLHAPNCIITPHIAWAPRESRQRIIDATTQNIQAFLDGAPICVVNP